MAEKLVAVAHQADQAFCGQYDNIAGNDNTTRLDPFAVDSQQQPDKVEKSGASAASSGSRIVYDGAGDVIPL